MRPPMLQGPIIPRPPTPGFQLRPQRQKKEDKIRFRGLSSPLPPANEAWGRARLNYSRASKGRWSEQSEASPKSPVPLESTQTTPPEPAGDGMRNAAAVHAFSIVSAIVSTPC